MARLVQVSAQQAKGRRTMNKVHRELEGKNKALEEKISELEGQMTRNEERRKKELVEQEKKWRQYMEASTKQAE